MNNRHPIPGLTSWRLKPQRNNASGYLGVSWNKRAGKWVAQMTVGSKSIHVGSFDDPKEAHEAYVRAKRGHHPKFLT